MVDRRARRAATDPPKSAHARNGALAPPGCLSDDAAGSSGTRGSTLPCTIGKQSTAANRHRPRRQAAYCSPLARAHDAVRQRTRNSAGKPGLRRLRLIRPWEASRLASTVALEQECLMMSRGSRAKRDAALGML